MRQRQAAHVDGCAPGPLPARAHSSGGTLPPQKNRAVWCGRRPICRLDLLLGLPAMVRICREVLFDNGGADDRMLFGRHECSGVACLSYGHTMAILPSVLNPAFETITGEAPPPSVCLPNRMTQEPLEGRLRRKSSPMTALWRG